MKTCWRHGRWREELPGLPGRWLLAPAWAAYRPAVALRNTLYDLGWLPALRLPVPVLSVGNIAAGGTGKTPVVRFLATLLAERGERPAILMRGYRGDGAANDEARTVVECPVVCDADRVRGGHHAIADGATCLILDDGFQHRRLHRDLDLVLIDATRPLPMLLPLGHGREPASALARASAVILTRGELVDDATRKRLAIHLARPGRPLIHLEEREAWLTDARGDGRQEASTLAGRAVLLASGLGNPQGFERSALRHGWEVLASWRFPDHHHYDARDAAQLLAGARRLDATLVVTAKDAVKLAPFLATESLRVLHQRVAVDGAGGPVLAELVTRALAEHRRT